MIQQHNAPNEPGWWAFEGGLNYGNGIILAKHIEMPVRVYWGDTTGEWQTQSQIGYHPARHLDGKWTRLHMPWESAPAAQPSRIICAACNDHLDPLEPSYCNICYDVMESAAQPQPTRGQPHVNVPWHPVDAILWDGKSLYADDLAVTIGEGDTALATFVWPSEGDYAVCKRMQRPDYNMGATYTRDGDVVTVDMQQPD